MSLIGSIINKLSLISSTFLVVKFMGKTISCPSTGSSCIVDCLIDVISFVEVLFTVFFVGRLFDDSFVVVSSVVSSILTDFLAELKTSNIDILEGIIKLPTIVVITKKENVHYL